MGTSIKTICESIKNLFTSKLRLPAKSINALLLIYSAAQRPGLSLIISYGNVMAELAKRGIPTGDLPDGSPNRMGILAYVILQEVFRALKEDANIQMGFPPGAVNFSGAGCGVIEGTNTNIAKGGAILS